MNRDDLYHKAAMTGKSLEELQLPEKVKRLEHKVRVLEKLNQSLVQDGCRLEKELAEAKGMPSAKAWQDLMFELRLSHLSRAEAADKIKAWKADALRRVTYDGTAQTLPDYEKPVIVCGFNDILYHVEGIDVWCTEDRRTGYSFAYRQAVGQQWFYPPEADPAKA